MTPNAQSTWRAVRPFAAALMLACGFGALLIDPDPARRAQAEGGGPPFISTALGPIGAATAYTPPVSSLRALSGVRFRDGEALDEGFRLSFAACDETDRFGGAPTRDVPHSQSCREAPNKFAAFVRLPSGAVYMQAHLGLDLSASYAACEGRPTDECAPFFDFENAPSEAYERLGARWRELFPVSDNTALISLPLRANHGDRTTARAFTDISGVGVGDVGIIVYRDKTVPVMVFDGAPSHRALAGSLALFDAIGVSRCRQRIELNGADHGQPLCADPKPYGLGAPVVAILFPGSAPSGLTPENLHDRVRSEALARFETLRAGQ